MSASPFILSHSHALSFLFFSARPILFSFSFSTFRLFRIVPTRAQLPRTVAFVSPTAVPFHLLRYYFFFFAVLFCTPTPVGFGHHDRRLPFLFPSSLLAPPLAQPCILPCFLSFTPSSSLYPIKRNFLVCRSYESQKGRKSETKSRKSKRSIFLHNRRGGNDTKTSDGH